MKEKSKSIFDRQIFSRVSSLDLLFFTQHLGVMLKSGIPLSEGLTSLRDQTKNTFFKSILSDVLGDINNGQSLEKSLSKHPEAFNPLYINLVGIGEKSGNLETNLDYLAIQMKKNYDFKKKVQMAMLYPEIVLLATVIVGWSLSIFVLPKLVEVFRSLDVKLPLTTKILLFVANVMKDYGILLAVVFVAFCLLAVFVVHLPKVKPKWHRFILSFPLIGGLMQEVEIASFCHNLSIMLKGGLTITAALEAQTEATDNLVYKSYVDRMLKAIEKGQKLSLELQKKDYTLIPPLVAKMIEVGEETGKLEQTLTYLGEFYEQEVEDSTKNLTNVLEPILLLGIGVVVAFVAIAIISPIYQLTGSIRR